MLLRVISAPASKSQQHCFWCGLLGPTLELWNQNLHLKPVQETLLNTNSWRWTWGFSGHVCLNTGLPYDGCRTDDISAVAWMCPLKSTGGERNPQCSTLGGGASWEVVRLWGRSEQINTVILGGRAPLSPPLSLRFSPWVRRRTSPDAGFWILDLPASRTVSQCVSSQYKLPCLRYSARSKYGLRQ